MFISVIELEKINKENDRLIAKLVELSVKENMSINDYNKAKIKINALYELKLNILKQRIKDEKKGNNSKILQKINYLLKKCYKENINIKII